MKTREERKADKLFNRATGLENPYWKTVVENIPNDPLFSDYPWQDRGTARFKPIPYGMVLGEVPAPREHQFPTRDELVKEYAWAIPSPEAIASITAFLNDRPVVEVGAGTGYWAWMLRQMGVDVVAYDLHPPDIDENWYHSDRETVTMRWTLEQVMEKAEQYQQMNEAFAGFSSALSSEERKAAHVADSSRKLVAPEVGSEYQGTRVVPGVRRDTFHPITQADASITEQHPDRVLFLCWPPYDDAMAMTALAHYLGDTVIYIGESGGGCTGDDAFHALLDLEWEEEAVLSGHVQWGGLHDFIQVYRRKEKP